VFWKAPNGDRFNNLGERFDEVEHQQLGEGVAITRSSR
jgi:hypothetical protein